MACSFWRQLGEVCLLSCWLTSDTHTIFVDIFINTLKLRQKIFLELEKNSYNCALLGCALMLIVTDLSIFTQLI